MPNIIMADVIAGGIPGSKITSYVTTSSNLYDNFTAARIQPISENEILVWNIRGTNAQTAGSEGKKMGIVVSQNGAVINNASGNKQQSGRAAPDSMTPSSSWNNYALMSIVDGYYVGYSNDFYCGVGNTIDFIQIPYNIGWNVSGG